MFHYLVTFKTSIQAYNSAPFFGQRRCDSRVQGLGALKLLKSMAHVIRFQSLYILSLPLRSVFSMFPTDRKIEFKLGIKGNRRY